MNGEQSMRAMVLDQPRHPLVLRECAMPQPAAGQVQIKIHACAVCRTDLHVVDGELPNPKLPLIIGHEIVGEVAKGWRRRYPVFRGPARWGALAWLDRRSMFLLQVGQ